MSKRWLWAAITLLILPLGPAAGGTEADQDETAVQFQKLREEYGAAGTARQKLDLVQDFLARFPESDYTARVLGAGTHLLSEELEDHQGAIGYAQGILARVRDPENVRRVRLVLLGLYGRPGHGQQLRELAGRMAEAGPLSFGDQLAVVEAATGAELWPMVLEYCEAAGPRASAEAFGADFPDEGYSEEFIQESGRHRRGLLETFRGWALARQGRADLALEAFAEAERTIRTSYLGTPENDLYLYWGRCLSEEGQYDLALAKLAGAALWGASREALTAARQTYAAKNGGEEGFDDYLQDVRRRRARAIDDFTMRDYQDRERTFSRLRGEVTLLTFWFPT